MNKQIEAIKKLYAKPKTYRIPKKVKDGEEQVSIEVVPLDFDQSVLFEAADGASPAETMKTMKTLLATSLQVSEEDLGQMPLPAMVDVLEAIMDVNGFDEQKQKSAGIKDFIKTQQDKIKVQKEKSDAKPA